MDKVLHCLTLTNYRALVLEVCILFLSPNDVAAQNCKPDKSVNDKFTREKYDYYNYDLKDTWNVISNTSTSATFSFAVVKDTAIIGVLTLK